MEQGFMLSPLDLIIIAVIGFGMYRGAVKSLLKSATAVFSIVAGVIFGFRLQPMAESLYRDYIHLSMSSGLMVIISFVTSFVVVYVIFSTTLNYLSGIFKNPKFQVDNALGALFGGFLATLALSVAFILMSYFGFPSSTSRQESVLYPYVREFSRFTLGYGADVLKQANEQINRYGFEKQDGTVPANTQPTNKPKPIR
ncbi:MAG: CvpA family protein [Bacteroidia bacterium]|nr:CvpA family protein [Bacteroidia bacterium]